MRAALTIPATVNKTIFSIKLNLRILRLSSKDLFCALFLVSQEWTKAHAALQ